MLKCILTRLKHDISFRISRRAAMLIEKSLERCSDRSSGIPVSRRLPRLSPCTSTEAGDSLL